MAAEESSPQAVEAGHRAQRLLIHFVVPGRAGGADQQERIEERVVDGALQGVRLVQARLAVRSCPPSSAEPCLRERDLGPGLHLQSSGRRS